jgi:putative transposase
MARPLRIEFPGALYHVTSRGNERKAIFRDDGDRTRFLERLAAVVARQRLRIHAYALMRNHYHLLVETPEGNLARALAQLNGTYTQEFNRRHHRSGHLLQGRYKAILVDKDAYLLELSRYIHLNPVRAGEVRTAWKYPWSSAAAYVGKVAAAACLTVEEVLGAFSPRPSVARQRYAAFLAEGVAQAVASPWAAVEGQVLLGDEHWVEQMKRRLAGRPVPQGTVAAKALRPRPALATVLTQVCRAAQMDPATMRRPRGGRGGWARPVAMALAWQVCGLNQREIGQEFGVSSYAVSKAITRAAKLAAETGKVGQAVRRLNSLFSG